MTKQKFIENMELTLIEEWNKYKSDGDLTEIVEAFFITIQAYIDVLKKSNESYEVMQSATEAFHGLLSNRLSHEIDVGLAMAENIEVVNKATASQAKEITSNNFSLVRFSIALTTIFCNLNTMLDVMNELKDKIAEDEQVYGKEYIEEKLNMAFRELATQELIEEFSCTRAAIENLEKLIGPQSDFDYVMGRSIAYTKYESR